MSNTKSAKKAALQSEARRKQNLARRTAIKSAIKKVHTALAEGVDAKLLLSDVAAKLARAKGKNVLHRNTASRKLSRLAKKVAAATRTAN
jgi:Ribosomal protein S20.